MDAIDDLVDANRLNVQLLASVPALLLVALGARLFFASLYTLRSRDLRSTRAVHAEMGECLARMERVLLLAHASPPEPAGWSDDAAAATSRAQQQRPAGSADAAAEAAGGSGEVDADGTVPTPPRAD
eukprot:2610376-Prymnesium_polylepis.1